VPCVPDLEHGRQISLSPGQEVLVRSLISR
jgi:hypothetical protein